MKVFITGSSDGLGKMAAHLLASSGHDVVVHGRTKDRADIALREVPMAKAAVVGDMSSAKETRSIAEQVNSFGDFDAVIHNAAVGYREDKILTDEGLPHVFAVNSLAPYVLTCLIRKPKRLIYLSSGLHRSGELDLLDLPMNKKKWDGYQAYSDSKLQNVVLAFAIARKWPGVLSNAMEPGWVATKMGGRGAPDNLEEGFKTQAWLAVSDDPEARVTGKYFFHHKIRTHNPVADDVRIQEKFLKQCAALSGVRLPS